MSWLCIPGIRSGIRWPAAWVALVLAACASSPEARFYTLVPQLQDGPAMVMAGAPLPPIVIDPPTLSELFDRPQWVARRTASEVDVLEQQRWAVPLRTEIPRIIGDNLSALLATREVSSVNAAPGNGAVLRVGLDVQAFEMLPTGEVDVDVAWRIHKGMQEVAAGRTRIREGVAGSDYEAAASAYSRALGVVSQEIAGALLRAGAVRP